MFIIVTSSSSSVCTPTRWSYDDFEIDAEHVATQLPVTSASTDNQ